MIKKLNATSVLLSLILILFSCNSTKKSSDKEKTTTDLITKTNKQIANSYIVTVLNDKKLTKNQPTINFDFDKNTVNGNNGCNRYGGNVIIEGDSIQFDRLMATKMYCADKAHIEKAFNVALSKSHHFKIKNDQFLLFDKANVLLLVGTAKN